MKKLFIFDLDGTLMNTLHTISGYANRALAEAGLQTFPEERYKYFVGEGARVLIERTLVAQNAYDEALHAKVFGRYNELYDGAPYENSAPYEGIPQMLDALAEKGIATRAVVSHFFPHHSFAAVHGAREGVALKPAPDGVRLILEELGGIDPSEALYLGDTATDMKTGKAAGIETVGVTWGFRDAEELRAHHADRIISHPSEIL